MAICVSRNTVQLRNVSQSDDVSAVALTAVPAGGAPHDRRTRPMVPPARPGRAPGLQVCLRWPPAALADVVRGRSGDEVGVDLQGEVGSTCGVRPGLGVAQVEGNGVAV